MFQPGHLVVRAGDHPRAVQVPRGGGVQRIDGEAGLAAAATPVTQVKVPSGMLAVTLRRLFARAPWTVSFLPLPLRRLAGMAISRRPVR